jgi:endonuclease YncB( thermonuclease family)
MRRARKGRGYYRSPRQRRSYVTSARRFVSRELRYFARRILGASIFIAVLLAFGLLSEQISFVPWLGFASKHSSSQSASTKDIVGRASVIDGDTLEIHGQRIRLWGIDTPESAQLCHVSGKPWRCGQQAALAVSDYIGQRTVACIEQDRDRYRRIVARCSVAAEDIGAWLVGNGWALDYTEYSGGAYASHQAIAASAKIGIWRGTFDKPWEWRRAN